MSRENEPTKAEYNLLVLMMRANGGNNHGKLLRTTDCARQLSLSKSGVSNLKAGLRKKGYLTQYDIPTEKALASISQQLTMIPARVPLAGKVQAGTRAQDELEVTIRTLAQLHDPDVPTITIPNITNTGNIVALTVEGISMKEEGIFEGDKLLVQLFTQNDAPKQGELIVTHYMASKDDSWLEEEQLVYGVPDELLKGPTVKYYYQHEDYYRLSPRQSFANYPYTIKTKYIKPIGRVIGVYRSLID